MVAAEADEGFKITDRRRRPAASEEPPGRPPATPGTAASRPDPEGRTAAASPEGAPAAAGERSLVGLFVMLGSTAAVALGAADPATGETHPDPAEAAHMIDLLSRLRERTEGHRTPEETQVLDALIYDLQLRYVRLMRKS